MNILCCVVKVDSVDNFDWQRQLRYYWDLDLDNCVARMALSQYTYAYEYLGACPRLVITPLTVRPLSNLHTYKMPNIRALELFCKICYK